MDYMYMTVNNAKFVVSTLTVIFIRFFCILIIDFAPMDLVKVIQTVLYRRIVICKIFVPKILVLTRKLNFRTFSSVFKTWSMLSNYRTVPLFGRNIFIAKFVYEE
jgi:hypothetical protein